MTVNNLKVREAATNILTSGIIIANIGLSIFSQGIKPETMSMGTVAGLKANPEFPTSELKVKDGTLKDPNINNLNTFKTKDLAVNAIYTDFTDLKKFPYLENLRIHNFFLLNDEDKTNINNSNIKKLTFVVQENDLYYGDNLDTSWVDQKIEVEFLYYHDTKNFNEINQGVIYNETKKINEELVNDYFGDMKVTSFKLWNYRYYDMLVKEKVSEDDSEITRLIKMVNYITLLIDYDPRVKEALDKIDIEALDEYTWDYDHSTLDSVLLTDYSYGVCVNYAATLFYFAYLNGIDLTYNVGYYNNIDYCKHAWCTYSDGINTYIIDPTLLDNNPKYINYRCAYNPDDIYSSKQIKKVIFKRDSAKYEAIKTFTKEDVKKESLPIKSVLMVNDSKKTKLPYDITSGALALSSGVLLLNKKLKKKKKKINE